MPGITYIIYLEAPYSIINYIQEAGRARRTRECIMTIIIIENKDWPAEDSKKDSYLELKIYKVNSLIRITDY
jgi:ERCC4-related helicase